TGIDDCSARAARGHAAAVQPINAMNSRRLMASPAPRTTSGLIEYHISGSRIVLFVTTNGLMRCPLWVKSGHGRMSDQCLLYPQKETLEPACIGGQRDRRDSALGGDPDLPTPHRAPQQKTV